MSQRKYKIDQGRKKTIAEVTMPTNPKSMQRFLGAALFFKSFVPNYSNVAANLHEMTQETFAWDWKTWKKDYEARPSFHLFIHHILGSKN